MSAISRRDLLKLAGASALVGFGLPARAGGVDSDVFDVAIVGAGLSGLTTARDLKLAGRTAFVVLEARGRVGGRTLNHELGGGQISDAGGQWIGPGQTAMADLARELDVGMFQTYYDGKTVILGGSGRLAIDLHGTFGNDKTIAERLTELAQEVPASAPWTSPKVAELDRLTLGEWLNQQGIKPEDRNGWDISSALTGGSSPAKVGLLQFLATINSSGSFERTEEIKGSAQETRFVGGSQLLSIKMARDLGDKVRLSCPVRRIRDWDRDVVTVHTDKGEVRAKRVVMALHPGLCNQIGFSPTLPPRRADVQREWPAFAPLRKTAMVYSRPFWRERGLNGSILQFGGPVLWAYDNSPPRGEIGVINAFINPGQVPSDPKAAQRVQAEIYAQALGPQALTPVSYHDHDWGTADEWAITCLPAIPAGFWTKHTDALQVPCGNLIWSGSECAERWMGYMEGAVRTGHSAASKALASLHPTTASRA